ncbi:hypothetical protein GCM10009623_04550 [Nocardioides aestuarii]|uniref:WD40 repeat domain-containing protein n=1 Tax=Nocardioides aestuarii TaxID=252231 RepID=A0ABW4TG41_9ACTN
MSTLLTTFVAAVAGLGLMAPTVPPTSVPDGRDTTTVDLTRPGTLTRGDDVRTPHLEGNVVVDGDRRIEVRNVMSLLGRTGDDYVVSTRSRRGKYRVKRVSVTSEQWVLLEGKDALGVDLSSDGQHLLRNDNRRRATISVYDASDGSPVASGRFRGYGYVLDADGGTAVVSSWAGEGRAVSWDFVEGGRTLVAKKDAYLADISTDRLATFTADPYLDGCTEVSTLSAPDDLLWESCRQKVATFSPDGQRMVTMHILTDGVGPGEVDLRNVDGSTLVTYTSRWFGGIDWEDDDTLLLDANSRRNGATVRCDLDVCELASDVAPSNP